MPRTPLLLVFLLSPVLGEIVRVRRPATPASVPTPAQAKWQHDEIMALVHFNMATFFHNGDPGCDANNWLGCDSGGGCNASDPASFAPTALNVSQWADSMLALGVTEAVLTAKHGCGFYIWPTRVTLPGGTPYPYAVNSSLNVLQQFSDTMAARGLGHGFYYSLTNNFFLNEFSFNVKPPSTLLPRQANVTQQQFEDIAVASITELWTDFGNLTEIWFDGGYQSNIQPNITALLAALQPSALALNGEGISTSPGRWSGTEGNVPPGWPNIYSTTCCNVSAPDPAHACDGPGCPPDSPAGVMYAPSSTDFTLQAGDVWFFEPGAPLRSLGEMVSTYHSTIGANTVMELDFAIDRTGNVAPTHAALYAAFGEWRRACYGTPLASAQLPVGAASVTLQLAPTDGPGVAFDRVVLQEALAGGQCVSGYSLEVLVAGAAGWAPFGQTGARLIGNKRIELGGSGPGVQGPALNATAVRFNVTATFWAEDGGCEPDVLVSAFAPEPCVPAPPPPPPPKSCVKFIYSDGRCLVTNATYPCQEAFYGSCPVFLGDCSLPTAVWDDGANDPATPYLTNLGVGPNPNTVNADCDHCTPHTIFKIVAGSPASIHFAAGQLQYTCEGASGLCVSGGTEGDPNRPCDAAEPFLEQQAQVEPCATAGQWTRQLA